MIFANIQFIFIINHHLICVYRNSFVVIKRIEMKQIFIKLYLWIYLKLVEREFPETLERKLIKDFIINLIRYFKNY